MQRDARAVEDDDDWYLPYNGPVEEPPSKERGRNPHLRPLRSATVTSSPSTATSSTLASPATTTFYTNTSRKSYTSSSQQHSPRSIKGFAQNAKVPPSFLSLDTGGIGESPVSPAPRPAMERNTFVGERKRADDPVPSQQQHARFVFPKPSNSATDAPQRRIIPELQHQTYHPFNPGGFTVPVDPFANHRQRLLSSRTMTQSAESLSNLAARQNKSSASSSVFSNSAQLNHHPFATASTPHSPLTLNTNTRPRANTTNVSTTESSSPTAQARPSLSSTRSAFRHPNSRPGPAVSTSVQPPHTATIARTLQVSPQPRLKASISTPDLHSTGAQQARFGSNPVISSGTPPNGPTNARNSGFHGLGLQAQTICDALLFPRPRLRQVPISPPRSPQLLPGMGVGINGNGSDSSRSSNRLSVMVDSCWPSFGFGSRSRSKSRERSAIVKEKEESVKEVVKEKVVGTLKRSFKSQPELSLSSSPALHQPPTLDIRPPQPAFAKSEQRPASPASTLDAIQILKANDALTVEREAWARQAQGSFANSRSRSASRTRISSNPGAGLSVGSVKLKRAGSLNRERGASREWGMGGSQGHSYTTSKGSNGTGRSADPVIGGTVGSGTSRKPLVRTDTLRFLQAQAFSQGGSHIVKPSIDSSTLTRSGSKRSNSQTKSFPAHSRTHSRSHSTGTGASQGHGSAGANMANGGSSGRTSESWSRAALNVVKSACGADEPSPIGGEKLNLGEEPTEPIVVIEPGGGIVLHSPPPTLPELRPTSSIAPAIESLGDDSSSRSNSGIGLAVTTNNPPAMPTPSPTPPPIVFSSHPFSSRPLSPPRLSPPKPLAPIMRAGPHPTSPTVQAAIRHRATGSGEIAARHRLPVPQILSTDTTASNTPPTDPFASPTPHPYSLSPEPDEYAQGDRVGEHSAVAGIRGAAGRYTRPSSGLVEQAFGEELLRGTSPFNIEDLPAEWGIWSAEADQLTEQEERERQKKEVRPTGAVALPLPSSSGVATRGLETKAGGGGSGPNPSTPPEIRRLRRSYTVDSLPAASRDQAAAMLAPLQRDTSFAGLSSHPFASQSTRSQRTPPRPSTPPQKNTFNPPTPTFPLNIRKGTSPKQSTPTRSRSHSQTQHTPTQPSPSKRYRSKPPAFDPESNFVDLNISTSSLQYSSALPSTANPFSATFSPGSASTQARPIELQDGTPGSPDHSNAHHSAIRSSASTSMSPASWDSSPKLSPRPLGSLDDLEMFKDLFYKRPTPTASPQIKTVGGLVAAGPSSSHIRPSTYTRGLGISTSSIPDRELESPIDTSQRSSLSEMRRSGLASLRTQSSQSGGTGEAQRLGESMGLSGVEEDEKELEPSIASSESSSLEHFTDENVRIGSIDVMHPSMIESGVRRLSTQPSLLSHSDDDEHLDTNFLMTRPPMSTHLSSDTMPSSRILPLSPTSPLSVRFPPPIPKERFPRTPRDDNRLSMLTVQSTGDDPFARVSFATSTSHSRISELMNEFPSPPPEEDLTLTPAVVLMDGYFPPFPSNAPASRSHTSIEESPAEEEDSPSPIEVSARHSPNTMRTRATHRTTFGTAAEPIHLVLDPPRSSGESSSRQS